MDNKHIETNRVYRHFKGNFYYVLSVGEHTENGELMVVYQALYGDHKIWVRPYAMFTEEVPSGKDNPTRQRYRFQLFDLK